MSESTTPSTTPSTTSTRRFGWPSIAVAVVFGLVYAYYLFDAIRSTVVLPAAYENAVGLTVADAPWTLLIIADLIPVVIYVVACVLGRRRSILGRALIFLAGLGVVATLTLSTIALSY